MNWNYARNIFPFIQNCGIVKYQDESIKNDEFFTDLGKGLIDIWESIEIAQKEEDSEEKEEILSALRKIEGSVLFQCLVVLMKNKDCNYSRDFFDVLLFAYQYGSIDSTEYLLIQHMRENEPDDYIRRMKKYVEQYRAKEMEINIKTQTKNGLSDETKSVNSFPYVHGNFSKAGVMAKNSDSRYYVVDERKDEVREALEKVGKIWEK